MMMTEKVVTTQNYGTVRIVLNSNNNSCSNELELERFADADTILPFYRIPLTGEHLAEWAVNALRTEEGCTCKRLVVANGITAGVRRATRKNSKLVYYYNNHPCEDSSSSSNPPSATIIRNGKEQILTFDELKADPDKEEKFILYVTSLI